jgi:hypothetical protein
MDERKPIRTTDRSVQADQLRSVQGRWGRWVHHRRKDVRVGFSRPSHARVDERLVSFGHFDDLQTCRNALDVFANSSAKEAFGLSVSKPLACGWPVLAIPVARWAT